MSPVPSDPIEASRVGAAQAFILRLLKNKRLVYVSPFSVLELLNLQTKHVGKSLLKQPPISANAWKKIRPKVFSRPPYYKTLFELRPSLLQHALPNLDNVLQYLRTNHIQILSGAAKQAPLETQALAIIRNCLILPPDAFIIANGLVEGLDVFASMDKGWRRLNSGTLYYHQ